MAKNNIISEILVPDSINREAYKKKKIGLFFGSFNPIHNGHLMIANYMLEFTRLDQIFFVVSPQNPFKEQKNLLDEHHRLALVQEAIGDNNKYRACNIEFKMPKPSYTIDTLIYLKEKYPEKEFSLIMGSDNLLHFHKWKNYKEIINNHSIYVYPRPGFDAKSANIQKNIVFTDAPLIEISSSFIRKSIKEKKDIHFFMPEKAWKYMREMHFYE